MTEPGEDITEVNLPEKLILYRTGLGVACLCAEAKANFASLFDTVHRNMSPIESDGGERLSDPDVERGEDNYAFSEKAIEVHAAEIKDPVKQQDKEKAAEEKEGEDEFDPWALTDLKDPGVPWKDLSTGGKVKRILWEYIGKIILLLALLYLFICSLDFLGTSFKMLGGKAAGEAFSKNELLTNPVSGLMIGVLGTVLLQSSSTTTSIVVTMVAANILTVRIAIPIIMGANIGTSVTNTIVAVGQMGDRNEFRKAFAGATVHDMFNWLCVLIFLPIEAASGMFYHMTGAMIKSMKLQTQKGTKLKLLKTITEPFTKLVIQIDKKIIVKVAQGNKEAAKASMIKIWCKYDEIKKNVTQVVSTNSTIVSGNTTTILPMNVTTIVEVTEKHPVKKCQFLFMNVAESWGDNAIGAVILVLALAILCICLVCIVKLLHSLLRGQIAAAVKKIINANFPGKIAWLTGYLAILLGAGLTILVQSSSIFTSALTPLVGASVLHIDRMYPLTLGANIGTTATSILASLAADSEQLGVSLQVALCHLFFNIFGILIWYPIPILRRVPLSLAKILGNTTAKYRWFAFLYLIVMFFLLPAFVFGLSVAGFIVLGAVGIPILLIFIVIAVINAIQRKRPGCLPRKLRNWNFLPLWLHSLRPLDNLLSKLTCGGCRCCRSETSDDTPVADVYKKENVYYSTRV